MLLDVLAGARESVEDSMEISTLLHGNDTELVLLIDPDEEGFGIVVEDTSALGPLTVETAGFQEPVSLPIFNIVFIS
jgi:hypothetical protein